MDDFPPHGRGTGDLIDKWMEILEPWSTGALVDEASPWSRPPTRTRCCPHACLLDRRLQAAPRQHFVILPNLLTDPCFSDERQARREAGSPHEYMSSSRQNTSTLGGSREPSCSRPAAGDCSAGKISSEPGKTRGESSPWQFSVDMSGCDEVRALTEKGMLMVEGRGSTDASQQMVRYITSLPRHVTHDSLTASLNNGRLTVTQKPRAQQVEGQARTLPIDVQQQEDAGGSMSKEKQTGTGKEKSETESSNK